MGILDLPECSAVYIDDRIKAEQWILKDSLDSLTDSLVCPPASVDESEAFRANLELLLDVCSQIYLCRSGSSFAAKLAELSEGSSLSCTPIFAFVDASFGTKPASPFRRRETRDSGESGISSNPFGRSFTFLSESGDSTGIHLLAQLSSDLQLQETPQLVVPVVILRLSEPQGRPAPQGRETSPPSYEQCNGSVISQSLQITRCLDAGAMDVLTQPLDRARVHGLIMHAYRVRSAALKALSHFLTPKKPRKQSWVGIHTEQPYAYLREAMVSKLMKSICKPEEVIDGFHDQELFILDERRLLIERHIGDWDFSTHHFTDDELLHGACKMLEHALTMPELERWRLTNDELRTFCLASRAAYNSFVLYHNFRHAVDVLQSMFSILLSIGILPPYPRSSTVTIAKSPIASLLTPFDALTLLISAIGHDVGHPGVNNNFLIKLKAPLAQLYNDNSVLEAFHCAAFSQILRRHWSAAFSDAKLRPLLISTILATDMCLHFQFIGRLKDLQQKYRENGGTYGWGSKDVETYRTLLCGLLIKCADISNVARPWLNARKWTDILQHEFAKQGQMEKEVGMETALPGGPPELGNLLKLATSQIGFMSHWALPLFEGVSDLFPQLAFTVQQIRFNKSSWEKLVNQETKEGFLQAKSLGEDSCSRHLTNPVIVARSSRKSLTNGETDQHNIPFISKQGICDMNANIKFTLNQPTSSLSTSVSRFETSSIGVKPTSQCGGSMTVSSENCIGSPQESPVLEMRADPQPSPNAGLETHLGACRTHKSCSSGQGSVASTSYGSSRATRAHSASTCTNTITTPTSPATNGTSFVTVDSGDEKDCDRPESGKQDLDYPDGENDSLQVPANLHAVINHELQKPLRYGDYYRQRQHASHFIGNFGKNHHVTTTIVGPGINSRASSPPTGDSIKGEDYFSRATNETAPAPRSRSLPRRKSRLRLAFWRRKSTYLQSEQESPNHLGSS